MVDVVVRCMSEWTWWMDGWMDMDVHVHNNNYRKSMEIRG